MSKVDNNYEVYRWLDDVQLLEPALVDEMNEIEELARAIEEVAIEHTELYTTS
jgi:hypothetical protein